MWLLPHFPRIARLAAFVYYRARYAGGAVPPEGPVLVVANHPNSLLDPMMVVAAARRPLRFLAKAPLFPDPKIGWLVRASGAIPVHRRQDGPAVGGSNAEMFREVHAALAAGDAVALFPEGISHSASSLAPLKTGAARIALGAAAELGVFPIVPVGLVFREKDIFRSDASAITGEPVDWTDLAGRGAEDKDAVRLLTDRITASLRSLTLNLEAAQDRPLVECAVRVWEVEQRVMPEPSERVARLAMTTTILAAVRHDDDAEGLALIEAVARHQRRLTRLGLRPADLVADVGISRGAGWLVGRAPFLMPLAALLGLAGWLLFVVPYRVTGLVTDRFRLESDVRSTWKLMVGAVIYLLWLLLLVSMAVVWFGVVVAVLTAVLIPVVGMAGLLVREMWRGSWRDARRYLVLRSRRSLMDTLRANQRELGQRLDALAHRFSSGDQR
jgi:glycerol-3-phosphate O-acyltransferase/dihydroxyacetone phosphate acyltransferase